MERAMEGKLDENKEEIYSGCDMEAGKMMALSNLLAKEAGCTSTLAVIHGSLF